MMLVRSIFLLLILPGLLTAALCPVLGALARRVGLVDAPDRERKTHTRSSPLVGGLAIWLAAMAVIGALTRFEMADGIRPFCLGITLMAAVGLLDDFLDPSAPPKLALQILAALVLVWAWRREWFDAYDAALWLAAFAMIEMDVLRSSRKNVAA